MKILFILPEYYPHSGAGISSYYLQYISAVKPYVEKIKIIVGSGYIQADERYLIDGIEIEYLKPELFNANLKKFERFNFIPVFKRDISAAWAMWEQVIEGDSYDIIECCDFGFGYIPWIIYHHKPIIIRLHGSEGQIELNEPNLKETVYGNFCRQTELLFLPKANRLITHSTQNKAFWENILNDKGIDYIPPLYYSEVSPIEKNKKEDFGIVCGRIQQWKGPDVLCRALQDNMNIKIPIKWFGRDTTFNGNQSKSRQLASAYPKIWNKRITACMPLSHDDLKAFQIKAKFAIVPSTWDMFNFTVLEYMASGTPVICSEKAGASDLIIDGINGYKFDPDCPAKLADQIIRVMNLSDSEYNLIVTRALETVKILSADKVRLINLKIYQEIILIFKVSVVNSYMQSIYEPVETNGTFEKILDRQTLKSLVRYILIRVSRNSLKWKG